MSKSTFDQLTEALEIWPGYRHAGGHRVDLPPSTAAHLIRALGANPRDPDTSLLELEQRAWRRPLAPVMVAPVGASSLSIEVVLPEGRHDPLILTIREEDGAEQTVTVNPEPFETREWDGKVLVRCRIAFAPPRNPGYHQVILDRVPGAAMALIMVPRACYLPPCLEKEERSWGFSVQLYGHRSDRNWGLGDFTDLADLVETSKDLGASFVGLNPLHALFPERPDRCTPYSPNSRAMLNGLYLDLQAVPDMAEDERAQKMVAASDFQDRLVILRAAEQLDYGAVSACKMPVLERLYQAFRSNHLSKGSARAKEFRTFVEGQGAFLKTFALFEALREKMALGQDGEWIPWQNWSASYRRPDSPEVRRFAEQNQDRIEFHLYVQWEADRQLGLAADKAKGLSLGLYTDLAVGFDRDGADCWAYQDWVPEGISVGCPPDLRNPLGQDWGVVPFSPTALAEAAYAPFAAMLRAVMRHASVIRIDHAFQLLRQFWVPLGGTAKEGGYVSYPMDDLMGIIALESHRNHCAVVAEDLGTIPEGFRERIMDKQALSFRVLHRERTKDRDYKAPADYPPFALAAPATHDQATLAGFWISRDLERRRELKLYPSAEAEVEAVEARQLDRVKLAEALLRESCLTGALEDDDNKPSGDMILAVHRFLARTPSLMTVVQFEDLFGQEEQANMPATIDEHPNWRRRYTREVLDLAGQPIVRALAAMMAEEGRSQSR
ncbi:4-alpha-glucanotransferase [Magnetospira sp. QH-2]|uniref:4-alpha-glucanotransferase n=1 Tax=Magnetospira sp. (strain QH-2) TaxID=1288970 RepID=UPI0003E81316|nr:4-alpha-glucanotransferase [Magnetospira sp. QH-2]CCQ73880.1 putative GH77 : related to 4-a-glucanotransferase / amylomaltase [Magnetospira sp. QH-2]